MISGMALSDDGEFVAVSSAKGTTHVFQLPPPGEAFAVCQECNHRMIVGMRGHTQRDTTDTHSYTRMFPTTSHAGDAALQQRETQRRYWHAENEDEPECMTGADVVEASQS